MVGTNNAVSTISPPKYPRKSVSFSSPGSILSDISMESKPEKADHQHELSLMGSELQLLHLRVEKQESMYQKQLFEADERLESARKSMAEECEGKCARLSETLRNEQYNIEEAWEKKYKDRESELLQQLETKQLELRGSLLRVLQLEEAQKEVESTFVEKAVSLEDELKRYISLWEQLKSKYEVDVSKWEQKCRATEALLVESRTKTQSMEKEKELVERQWNASLTEYKGSSAHWEQAYRKELAQKERLEVKLQTLNQELQEMKADMQRNKESLLAEKGHRRNVQEELQLQLNQQSELLVRMAEEKRRGEESLEEVQEALQHKEKLLLFAMEHQTSGPEIRQRERETSEQIHLLQETIASKEAKIRALELGLQESLTQKDGAEARVDAVISEWKGILAEKLRQAEETFTQKLTGLQLQRDLAEKHAQQLSEQLGKHRQQLDSAIGEKELLSFLLKDQSFAAKEALQHQQKTMEHDIMVMTQQIHRGENLQHGLEHLSSPNQSGRQNVNVKESTHPAPRRRSLLPTEHISSSSVTETDNSSVSGATTDNEEGAASSKEQNRLAVSDNEGEGEGERGEEGKVSPIPIRSEVSAVSHYPGPTPTPMLLSFLEERWNARLDSSSSHQPGDSQPPKGGVVRSQAKPSTNTFKSKTTKSKSKSKTKTKGAQQLLSASIHGGRHSTKEQQLLVPKRSKVNH